MTTGVNKGVKGKGCNRTACNSPEAYYYNKITEAYYCQSCAFRINKSSNQSGLGDLCTISDEDRDRWKKDRKYRAGIAYHYTKEVK